MLDVKDDSPKQPDVAQAPPADDAQGNHTKPIADYRTPALNTAVADVDALFVEMARNRQQPEVASDDPAARSEQPLHGAVRETQGVLATVPVRTLLGRIYAALALIVVGPPAFFGLRRTAQSSPVPARVPLHRRDDTSV
jgi:hypothetical protein